jgi:FG-GAP-like repeat/Bacterial Ig-like domain (group 3)
MSQSTIVALRRSVPFRQVFHRRWMPVMLSALALAAGGPAAWATAATTTSLFTTPDNPSSGAVITMTAQVAATEFTVAGGTVTFTDTYNSVTEVLGTVQVQSTNGNPGTAILEVAVGGVGVHQFVANYGGTSVFATSASTAQSVTFTGPYLTSTALTSAGTAGNYTLTGTVSAFGPVSPTGSVTFTDTTSNFTLGTAALNTSTLQTGFTPYTLYPVANMNNGQTGSTIGPAIGDFNGDGRPDYAVPTNSGPIAILLGAGNGTFTNGTTISTTSPFEPTSVVVGDFNGDGKQDLAVLSAAGIGSVNIYLGNGDGTFQTAKNYPAAASTSASRLLAVGDFNRDGIQDLVATNSGLNNVAVLLGIGDGSFQAPSYYAVGNGPWNVVVGDLNQDGFLDLAVASDGSSSVSILQGNGDGTFKAYITANTGGSQVGSVAIGDFNGDGYPDLATTSAPNNSFYILLNKATATTPSFQTAVPYALTDGATATGPYYLTIGDFDRDGNLDIIAANNGNATVSISRGTGTGTFGTATYYPVGSGDIFANVGDINGDDRVDITAVTGTGLAVLLSGQSESASISNVAFYGCGTQSVTATYGSDSNYGSSTSSALTFTPAKQTTALVLTVTPTTGVVGQQFTLQAKLSPSAYGSITTNGETVTFSANGASVGTATLSGGVATLVVTPGATGTYSVNATYPGDCTFSTSTSNSVAGTVLQASTLSWPTPAPITYGTPLSSVQLNATDSVAGTFAYTPASGTVLNAGTNALSVTFTPTNNAYGVETATVQLTVTQDPTAITWPTPTPITYGTALSGFQLDATASSGTVSVPLSTYYNVYGIYSPGTSFGTGGFDNDGSAYSTLSIGSTIVWNGLNFNIGPANALDAVANTTVTLPAGKYTNLYLLGAMVNNISAAQTFTVTYTDGTTTQVTQNMSDWVYAAGWPGESVVNCNYDRNLSNGTTQADSVCVYGYQIALNSAKTVQSIALPATRNIVFLSMDLTTPPIPGTFVYNPPAGTIEPVGTNTLSVTFTPTNTTDYSTSTASVQLVVDAPNNPIETPTIQWPTPAAITYGTPLSSVQLDAVATALSRPTPVVPQSQLQVLSTSTDGTGYLLSGFDGSGNTYSYKHLGNGSVIYAGTTFTLGQPTVPNAITNGAVYTLPAPGNYSSVYLIGAATTTGQTNEPFILTYNDSNGTVTDTVNMSSWSSSAGYAGETIIATTPYANTQGGGENSGTYDLYGYQIPVDPTRTLLSVTLPSTRNVVIMALGFGSNTQAVVPGSYVYTPVSGTVLPVGTNPLSVTFTPTNTAAYTTVSANNSIVVTQATPVINWPTPAAIAQGTALGSTQLDAAATYQGASLPGTYNYTVLPANTPASGAVLAAGTWTLQVVFTPTNTVDYTTATATVQIVVGTTGSTGISGSALFPSGDCCFFSQPTPYAITVSGSTAAPTGTVNVVFNGQTLASGTLTATSGTTSTATLNLISSYFTPGNNTVKLNYLGDGNYVPNSSSAVIPLRNPAIGANPAIVNGGSSTIQVPYAFPVAGAITFNFNPSGGGISDFSNTGATTCASGVQETAGAVCIFSIAFKPGLPGIRKGVVQVNFTSSGGQAEPILYLFLSGLGSAAQISLSSATQQLLNSTLNQPQSLTFNPSDLTSSSLYVANSNAKQIDTLPSSGGALTQWNPANTTNLVYPSDLVFDAFGDLVVSDANAAMVVSFNPALAESTVGTGTYTLGLPTAAKIDLGGNLYIADAGNTPRIIEVPGETYALYTPSLLSLGSQSVSFPQALAVDNAGANLYVGDGNTNQILQIALNGTGATPIAIAPCDSTVTTCALNSPAGIAFDPNGDMFITDSGQRVLMVPAAHSASAPTTQVPLTGLINPTGIVLDGSGNIFVSDLNTNVNKLLVNSGALKLTTLNSSLTTSLTNTGNLNLTISGMTFANGSSSAFTQTNTCSGSIAPGGSCTITVTYSQTGPATDTLTITSNAFSASGVTIALTHN